MSKAFAAVAVGDMALLLVIVGPDYLGLHIFLQHHASALGIDDRITWPDILSGDLKWANFRCAELFCLTTRQEDFGDVVEDPFVCGLPVAIAEPVNIAPM